ncbi:hypothetical protein BJ322DRAFT_1184000 [Thelephora terrestris]|uniref:Uncharacterized protein n=1 Tax=Thelephora terrestris TaxID=56493 RepID=A0A9P6L9T5_9AGAM|nr:hypothetical protein BJ322DRAFT_1184000 [Thelephora terrestris]
MPARFMLDGGANNATNPTFPSYLPPPHHLSLSTPNQRQPGTARVLRRTETPPSKARSEIGLTEGAGEVDQALSGHWVDAEEGHSSRSWICFDGAGEWRNRESIRSRLPPSVNDGTLLISDVLVTSIPSFGVDRFTDTTQHSDRAEVSLGVAFTETTKETDDGGSSVELGDLALLDKWPITGWSGVDRGRLEDGGGDTVEKRALDDVSD